MTAVRRSGRAKQQAGSYYEEAKKKLEVEEEVRRSMSPRKSKRKSSASSGRSPAKKKARKSVSEKKEDDDDDEQDATDEEEVPEEEDDESEEESEDEAPKKRKKPAPKKVQVGKSTQQKKRAPRKQGSVLATLARKVLEEDETPATSIVAALLYSNNGHVDKIKEICRTMVFNDNNADDPNETHRLLLNVLFRVVGGTSQSALSQDLNLDDMDDVTWAQLITNVVDDMRYTAPDQVLFCADPLGAVHAAHPDAPVTQASLGVRTFRTVHDVFWFQLATVALVENVGDDDNNNNNTSATNRFAIDMVSNILSRLYELIEVAQPDIRAAAVVACLQMSCAVLQQTVELQQKMTVTARQLKAAQKKSKKAEALQFTLDSLTRSCDDLEALVDANFSAVFMNRYRDSNPHIRATTIAALGTMCCTRPDLYLCDKYLKYIGWTLSDKSASVRRASLQALTAPFRDDDHVANMKNVITKFLSRLADCTIDVDVGVQQDAMALFLELERASFLEELDDDSLWEQINNRALASDTSPHVRRDALYFIIDQLEAFDDDDEQTSNNKKWSKGKAASLAQSLDKTAAKKLSTLAGWISHTLTEGPIPVDKIRIELTDYIVDSLRAMPEHAALVTTHWSAMVRAITDTEDDVVQQRVLVRMLARAAQAEVGTVAAEFLHEDVDPALAELETADQKALMEMSKDTTNKKSKSTVNQHEVLSVALLKALPNLLVKFKTDPFLLVSVTSLPRLLKPSVLSLPNRKADVCALVQTLTEIYTHTGHEAVLQNCSSALSFLSGGQNVRAQDAQLQLSKLATDLSQRLMELLGDEEDDEKEKEEEPEEPQKKKGRMSKGRGKKKIEESDDEDAEEEKEADKPLEPKDKEFAVSMCLRRLRILSKRMDLSQILDDAPKLREAVLEGVSSRLEARQIVVSDGKKSDDDSSSSEKSDEDNGAITVPEIWQDATTLHEAFAESVKDSLDFLLSSLAWSFHKAKDKDPIASAGVDDEEDVEDEAETEEDRPIVHQRDQLVDFICLCFEQYLPSVEDDDLYSDEQLDFSSIVQTAACQTASDLRTLFPKEWAEAASPLLRACALTDDKLLIGGCVRFFRSEEESLRDVEDQEFEDLGKVCDLLLPFCRHFAANWSKSNRREAGFVLAHIVGSGQTSQQMLTALSRMVKKINPVHLLETHMACLVSSFDDWLNNEPEELESDRPTDEEMVAYDNAEKEHKERFDLMVQQGARLSQSLGVGKLDPQLQNPLLGFCREGIRYAFSTELPGGEDPLLPGGRLTFLALLSKYVNWIRRNSSFDDVVVQNVLEREEDLRADPDFEDAHEDDLAALAAFRKTIGLKAGGGSVMLTPAKSIRSTTSQEGSEGSVSEDDSGTSRAMASTKRPRSKSSRLSHGSSMGSSIRSGITHTLSPLMEEGGSDDDDDDESTTRGIKRRKLSKVRRSSVGSAMTMGTLDKDGYNSTIEEEGSGVSSSDES